MHKTRRLFFALWPDERIRNQLDAVARQYRPAKSHAILPTNLHATLIFLGPQPQELMPAIQYAATAVKGQAFTLVLQQIQLWRRPQVMCLCPAQVPEALLDSHRQLRQALVETGLDIEDRKYRPHITLARKARQSPELDQLPSPIKWPVNSFSLIESVSSDKGVRYLELHHWLFDS